MLEFVAGQRGQPGRGRVVGGFGDREHDEQRQRERGQGGPPIPGAPAADLMLIQATPAGAGLGTPPRSASGIRRRGPGWPAGWTEASSSGRRPARRWCGCGGEAASAGRRGQRGRRRRGRVGRTPSRRGGSPWRRARPRCIARPQRAPGRPGRQPGRGRRPRAPGGRRLPPGPSRACGPGARHAAWGRRRRPRRRPPSRPRPLASTARVSILVASVGLVAKVTWQDSGMR
jgi:hypothetical protein